MVEFQCAVAARDRDEPMFATASQVHRWLLVEVRGAWGRDAIADSDLARYATASWRQRLRTAGIRVIAIRRDLDRLGGGGAAVLRRVRAGGERAELDPPRRHAASRRRGLRRAAGARRRRRMATTSPTAGAGVHERAARSLLRHVRTPAHPHPARVAPTRRRVGVLAHRWGPLRRKRRNPARRPLLRSLRRSSAEQLLDDYERRGHRPRPLPRPIGPRLLRTGRRLLRPPRPRPLGHRRSHRGTSRRRDPGVFDVEVYRPASGGPSMSRRSHRDAGLTPLTCTGPTGQRVPSYQLVAITD